VEPASLAFVSTAFVAVVFVAVVFVAVVFVPVLVAAARPRSYSARTAAMIAMSR